MKYLQATKPYLLKQKKKDVFYDDTRYRVMFTLLLHFPCNRVQREQIVAKQQEEETARLKNCGRIPKGSKDGLRPESPHSRRTRRPSVRKMLHASKKRYEVICAIADADCNLPQHFKIQLCRDCLAIILSSSCFTILA